MNDKRNDRILNWIEIDKLLRSRITIPLWMNYQNTNYSKQLKLIRELHAKSLDEIRNSQFNRLKQLLNHAYEKVPYYQEEFKNVGLEPGDIKSYDDFQKLPILTKNKFRNNLDKILSIDSDKSKLIKSGTGGTTDSPITIYYDQERNKFKEAEMHYFREWYDWNFGDRVAYLWGAPQDIPNADNWKYKIINRATFNKTHFFSSLMNEEKMQEFFSRYNKFKPHILQGYSNPTYLFADFILKNKLKAHRPKSVVLTAEPCLPKQRKLIEKAFGTKVFTFYGCREGGYVGSECNQHNGYHINCSSIYMEFLSESGQINSDEISQILFTDLYNYDTPMIRYKIGDLGIYNDKPCPCGSPLPVMGFFAGRETDVFVTPDGSYVPGVSFCDRIIEECQGIQQLQFIQDKVDELVVKIVKGPEYSSKDMDLLDKKLESYFNNQLNIVKKFVEDIPKEKSGKTRFCISNIAKI